MQNPLKSQEEGKDDESQKPLRRVVSCSARKRRNCISILLLRYFPRFLWKQLSTEWLNKWLLNYPSTNVGRWSRKISGKSAFVVFDCFFGGFFLLFLENGAIGTSWRLDGDDGPGAAAQLRWSRVKASKGNTQVQFHWAWSPHIGSHWAILFYTKKPTILGCAFV